MKRLTVAALAALLLAGSAAAQNGAGSSAIGGVNNESSNQAYGYDYRPPLDQKLIADYRSKVKAYKMACVVDRQTRCEGRRSADAVWSCLRLRRSTLTPTCRDATYAVERAAADANLSD